jgi:hypothetical protein
MYPVKLFGTPTAVRSCALLLGLAVAPGLSFADTVSGNLLTGTQQQTIARAIESLHGKADREVARQWTDAKKVAEVMCRPLALERLRHAHRGIDRVFLGDADAASLSLHSNALLEGIGQARVDNDWKTFAFSCGLDPRSGRAISFTVHWDDPSITRR